MWKWLSAMVASRAHGDEEQKSPQITQITQILLGWHFVAFSYARRPRRTTTST
jgi:hypothetical protein